MTVFAYLTEYALLLALACPNLPMGIADMIFTNQRHFIAFAAAMALFGANGSAQAAPDLGKRACAQEAKRLCPAEMRSFSRRRVEACMITKIDQTSPICHAAMLRIKAEREAAMPRQSAIR